MSGLRVFSRVPRNKIIEGLRRFSEVAKQMYPNIVEVILVGSVARDEHGPMSDVDVVVVYRGEEPDYARLKVELVKAVDMPADLILVEESMIKHLSPRVRKEWLDEGVRL